MKNPLIIQSILLVSLIVVAIGGIVIAKDKIQSTQETKKEEEAATQKLQDKLSLLSKINSDTQINEKLVFAVPTESPLLSMVKQLRGIAEENALRVVNLRVLTGETKIDERVSQVEMEETVEGSYAQILTSILGIQNAAPLMQIQKVKLEGSSIPARATIQVASFWAPYPASLPAVTDSIEGLTTDDQTVLTKIESLVFLPQAEVIAASESGRLDPFSL